MLKKYTFPALFGLFLIYLIGLYGVDIPFWDQWSYVVKIQRFYEGTLAFRELFEQHNEHRIFFPLLIMLPLMSLSDWNIWYELGANVVLGVGIFLVIFRQFDRTFRLASHALTLFVSFLVSILTFSTSQFENWLWGWQIQIFLNVLMVCLGFSYLSTLAQHKQNFVYAILCGVVAVFSFANGMAYWLIGFLFILIAKLSLKQKAVYASIWLAIFVLLAGFYFYDYHKPVGHPPLSYALTHLSEYVQYVLVYLGRPIVSSYPEAMSFSLVALVIQGYVLWLMYRTKYWQENPAVTAFLGMSLYALMSASITGLGRVSFGLGQAITSRYVTISNLFWICFVAMLLVAWDIWAKKPSKYRIEKYLIAVLFITVSVSCWVRYQKDKEVFATIHQERVKAKATLLSPKPDDELVRKIFGEVESVKKWNEFLRKQKLSLHRHTP